MTMRERHLIKQGVLENPVITEPTYVSVTIRKGYLESLAHTIQAGLSSIKEQEQKIRSDYAG